MSKPQFASPEWIAMMRSILSELVEARRDDLADADFSMCEVITDVPPEQTTAVLSARFRAGTVEFFEDETSADYVVRGDYEAMLPGAKIVLRGATPEVLAEQGARRKELAAAGRVTSSGDMTKASKPIRQILARMHDLLAEQTR